MVKSSFPAQTIRQLVDTEAHKGHTLSLPGCCFHFVPTTLSLPSCRVNPKVGDCVVKLSLRAVLVLEGALLQYFIF